MKMSQVLLLAACFAFPSCAREEEGDDAGDVQGSLLAESPAPSSPDGEPVVPDPQDPSSHVKELVGFDWLADFPYEPPSPLDTDASKKYEIPAKIRALSGTTITVEGYMVPIKIRERRVLTFILSRYVNGCCFTHIPRMNEWLDVEMEDEDGVEYEPFDTVKVTGILEVGEDLDKYGYVNSIYRLKATKVE